MDLKYATTQTFWLDLKILLRTLYVVMKKCRWQKKFRLSSWESLRRTITEDSLRPCASLLKGRTVEMEPFQRVPRILAITMVVVFLVVLGIVHWHP